MFINEIEVAKTHSAVDRDEARDVSLDIVKLPQLGWSPFRVERMVLEQ